ncbi:tyrosine-protein phosphatase [Saccharomonospora sp. CUA-673]|uniref:tyrosine-protein phosphatase n=1 Tax=Saccharomonospora sp. CUA-673 TaxID=1904969 RepID=UPI003513EDDF
MAVPRRRGQHPRRRSLPTTDGAATARGRLLRADNLQDLSPADIALLVETVGLDTVVDLRTAFEIESEGPGPLRAYETVRHVHHSLLPESGGDALLTRDRLRDAAHNSASGNGENGSDDELGRMVAHYLGYVALRPDSIVGALRAIADAPGTALVHCAAGKDRTGVVTAFALEVAGVDRATIAADYAATAERIEAIIRRLRGTHTYRDDIDRKTIDEHRPHAASMDQFLAEVDRRHGGVHTYLDDHGFGADDLTRLRTKLRD